jgi:hypothetical protein
MSESVYGVELPTLRDAIAAHELQGYEDLGPYIFTKVSKKKKGTSSSGFGPGQITASTAEDMLARYPSLFDDEFRDYVNRFVTQGTNKLNLDYYGSLYKDGDRIETSKADREMFGPLGKGNIPEEDHAKFYNRLFDLVIRDKAKNAKDLNSFLQNYHGAGTGGTQKNIDYAQSVQKKLEGLGVSVAGAADPAGFGGMPLPIPKPEKEAMPMPTPKPDGEQYIDQEGEIADTGEDVEMEEPGLLERIKPFVPVYRHMNEGGMAKQMELFEDGGLRQEGGTIDPVSGNDVPPGSLQEEVRDDIPAQLSEGEFVFPADVVRYIGLEKLMQMRQEAKQGLQMMEDMGQMGNGDEAIMPDDIPFDLSDLDMDDDLEYNVGGFVPGVQQQQGFTGIANYQPPQMQQGVGSYVPAPMPQYQTTQMPGAYVPPQQAAVPTMQVPTQMPQFGQFTEQNVETREYTNSETGEKRVFTFINGQPTVPIPPGFVPSSEYVKPETAKPVQEQVTTETTRVTEDDDKPDMSTGATIAFGGNIIPGTTQSVENMFKGNLEVGGLGFGEGRAYAMSTFAPGQQNIPEGGFATITNITLPRPDGVYAGTGQPLGNNMRMDANIFNKYMAGDGRIKVTERTKMARVGQHIKEMYTDKGVTGMTVDVDQRMINQIDQIDEARKQLKRDRDTGGDARRFTITERDDDGNVTNIANVSKKVAQEIASGVDIEAAAFDYDLPAPPSAVSLDPRTQQDEDPGESGGGTSYSFSEGSDFSASEREALGPGSYNTGGLAAKKKPKVKKMKRGGLASKK